MPVRDFAEGRYVLMVTRKGVIKKTSLADFQNIRSNGIIAINIDEGDELLDVVLTDGTKRIFIATHNGLAIRFDEKNARPMGRATRGMRGIDLRKDDFVVSVCRGFAGRFRANAVGFRAGLWQADCRSPPIVCRSRGGRASST